MEFSTKLGFIVSSAVILTCATACGPSGWKPAPCPQCKTTRAYPGLPSPKGSAADAPAATVASARAFMEQTEKDLRRLWVKSERAAWINRNFITSDTQEIVAEAEREKLTFMSAAIKKAKRFLHLKMPTKLARKFKLLTLAERLPAPSDPRKTAELASITSSMTATYGKGKYCPEKNSALRKELKRINKGSKQKSKAVEQALKCSAYGKPGSGASLGLLSGLIAKSNNEKALREAWVGWRRIAPPLRNAYRRYVELGNQGAKELGFQDIGNLWRSGYDMPPATFRQVTSQLYTQVQPFYEELHCYVRMKLQEKYGKKLVQDKAPIPAHLLGNMWSQSWGNVYNLVEPYKGQGNVDVTKALAKKKYTAKGMVKLAENFFVSLGLAPLPKTFWERSLFSKPQDRDVVCHASAWDVHYNNDLRIKMCIERTGEELQTIHHELGHNYYYRYYYKLPILFQTGAHDGFHEAIGDAIALSITPGYLEKIGLISKAKKNDKATINFLMKMALDKVAFLPFGKLIDEWRWDVFDGKIPPHEYNKGWWKLRGRYQGITPPVARSEKDFDPGAKYHVPANVPYTRYFLAFILQFQFQRALCKSSGHTGPLHTCSIYKNAAAGEKMKALLSLGASKPWQDALEAMSGERAMDGNALLEYFAPLRGWLRSQIKGQRCGW